MLAYGRLAVVVAPNSPLTHGKDSAGAYPEDRGGGYVSSLFRGFEVAIGLLWEIYSSCPQKRV